jgi:peptidoglycan/xylan/chitin deacetylase (PgdA/CDA1 family)
MKNSILFSSRAAAVLFFVCFGFSGAALASDNLIANPSLEIANATGNAPAEWAQETAGSNDAVFSYLDSGAQDGTRSVKITMTWRTSGSADLATAPISVTAGKTYLFQNYYKSSAETETDVEFQDADGNLSWKWLGNNPASADWKAASYAFTVPEGITKIRVYQALAAVGYLQTDNYSFKLLENAAFNRGIVSIVFDDGLANIYQNALPIINQYGFKSTQYIVSGAIGSRTKLDLPAMTKAQISTMYKAGHEIGSHTVNHPDLTSLSTAKLNSELSNSKKALNVSYSPVNNFAVPFGRYNDTVIAAVKKYYGSARTSDGGENTLIGFDQYRLKTQYVTNTTTLAEVESWLAQAVQDKAWLIILYHNVANGGSYEYTATKQAFSNQLAAIKNSGLPVLTVSQALAEINSQL